MIRRPLHERLADRAAEGRPLRVVLVGAGTFGAMLLSQLRRLEGIELCGVADRSLERARDSLAIASWPADIPVTADATTLIDTAGADVVVEATGSPTVGIEHAVAAIDRGSNVVMVSVEADVLAGPVLSRRARSAGIVYSLAYGDQPALVCELVEWAQACGLDVVCAGKGTKYLPAYHLSTPDTVWEHYGLSPDEASVRGFNARMFNSFVDGTKSSIETAAVANATGLRPQPDGLGFPPCAADRLAAVCIPAEDGGTLAGAGTVEVVSSLERDGTPVQGDDLRWGVYVTFEAPTDYVAGCFTAYGLATGAGGRFASLYRPYHLIGLETSVSVLRVGLDQEPTGTPRAFVGDVTATAKRDLVPGDVLDGEGGSTVWGRLAPTAASLADGALPIGLADGIRLIRPVAAGRPVRWADVEQPQPSLALDLRRELERDSSLLIPVSG